ncbi:MAG TPA: MFS transporter [Acidimicrobiales bacterium]
MTDHLATVAASVTAPDGVWAPARRRLTTGLVLTITLVAFEALAIATIMPVVSDDLGGLGLYGWVFSGFFLGNLLGIVLAGEAADRRGTRAPFLAGLVLFSLGLIIGGSAQSMPMLVAGRVAQGVGAGVIPAVAYASVGRGYPPELRPRVFAVFSSAWVVPGLIGPAAASAIERWSSWRVVFLALLPLVAVAAAMTLPALSSRAPAAAPGSPAAGSSRDRRRDAVVLVAGVALVLGGLGAHEIALTIALVVIGALPAAWAFVRLVPTGTAALRRGMPAAVGVRGILTFAFFGTDAYVSLAMTDARDQPTWVAGLALTGATLAWTTGAWVQQRLVGERGPAWLVRRGFALLGVGIAGLLVALDPSVPVAVGIAAWSVAGLGMGLAYAPISVTVLGTAAPGQEGSASASLQLTDVLGVSLGTGLGGVFVALGDGRNWNTSSSLTLAFIVTLAVAAGGVFAARRLPRELPAAAPT